MLKKTKRTDVRCSLTRVTSGVDFWSLRVEDVDSGILALSVDISDEDFVRMMASGLTKACPATWIGLDKLGTEMLVKQVTVPLEDFRDMESFFDKVEAEYPGWSVDRGKFNHHCMIHKDNLYRVTIRRWRPSSCRCAYVENICFATITKKTEGIQCSEIMPTKVFDVEIPENREIYFSRNHEIPLGVKDGEFYSLVPHEGELCFEGDTTTLLKWDIWTNY